MVGSGQTRQVMDIGYLSGESTGSSLYLSNISHQCVRNMDAMDDFSPGFGRQFLQYIPVHTITKIEYLQTGEQSSTTCPITTTPPTITETTGSTVSTPIGERYTIQILEVDYDPQ